MAQFESIFEDDPRALLVDLHSVTEHFIKLTGMVSVNCGEAYELRNVTEQETDNCYLHELLESIACLHGDLSYHLNVTDVLPEIDTDGNEL